VVPITLYGSDTPIAFDFSEFDTAGFAPTIPTTTLTAPLSGKYYVSGDIHTPVFGSTNTDATIRGVYLLVNGVVRPASDVRSFPPNASETQYPQMFSLSTIVELTAGDTIQLVPVNSTPSPPVGFSIMVVDTASLAIKLL
jgi:hypothetical protein